MAKKEKGGQSPYEPYTPAPSGPYTPAPKPTEPEIRLAKMKKRNPNGPNEA